MRWILLVATTAPVLTGCGLVDETVDRVAGGAAVTTTVTAAPSPTWTPWPTPDREVASAAPSNAPEPRAPADSTYDATQFGGAAFVTPSGNIGCWMQPSDVRCDIIEMSFDPPPAPASCEYPFGHTIVLGKGPATFACSSEPIHTTADVVAGVGASGGPAAWWWDYGGNPRVSTPQAGQDLAGLAYGKAIRVGSATCRSSEAGVACSDQATGKGFTLARGAWAFTG